MDNYDEIMAAEHEKAIAFEDVDSKEDGSIEAIPQMPVLPDGIGLNYEDIRKILALKHDTNISVDDPILMMVTLCNAFIGEQERVNKKHNDAVTNIMAAQSKKYIDSVKLTTDSLSKTLAETSVDAIRNIFDSHASALNTFRNNTRWCTTIIGVAALANLVVMAFGFWR